MSDEAATLLKIQGLETAARKLKALAEEQASSAKLAKKAWEEADERFREYVRDPSQKEMDFDG